MGLLSDLLQAATGEASLSSALGRWRQAVSGAIESAQGAIATVQVQIGSLQLALSSIKTSINVQDEGVPLGEFTTFDFIGAGVQVFPGPNETAIVFVPSGGGGFPGYGGAPPNIGTSSSPGVSLLVSRSDHTHGHGDLPGGTLHAVATPAIAGFMSAADKGALDTLVAGAPYASQGIVLTAGAGMTGGGDLSAPRTFDIVNLDGSIVVNPNDIAVSALIQSGAAAGATALQVAGGGLTESPAHQANVGNLDGSIVVGADEIHVSAAIQAGAAAGATALQVAGSGLTESPAHQVNVGNLDGSIVIGADEIHVAAAIQAGAALGATSVQDVVEMYGPGAGHVQGVAATPGWTVLEPGAFLWSNALSDPYVQAIFRAILLVTDASMTGRVRLFDVTAGVPVATSVVSSSSLTDVTQTTANILGDLVDGHLYQFQAEATGTADGSAFVFVRSAVLICQL